MFDFCLETVGGKNVPTVNIWFTQVCVLFQLEMLHYEFTAAFPNENRHWRLCHLNLELAFF